MPEKKIELADLDRALMTAEVRDLRDIIQSL